MVGQVGQGETHYIRQTDVEYRERLSHLDSSFGEAKG